MNGTFLVNTTCVVKKLIANCIVYFFDVTPSFGQSWLIFMMKNHNIIIEEFVFTILSTGVKVPRDQTQIFSQLVQGCQIAGALSLWGLGIVRL